jgi:hypothetical protein
MEQEEPQKKSDTDIFGDKPLSEAEQIKKWRDSAFHAAMEKLQEKHGNAETVMQIGEAFGRGLFSQRLKDKSPEWTIKTWLESTEEDIIIPLGAEFVFTKVSHDVATTFLNRDPLRQYSKDSTMASLFDYGVLRGLFLSAFPKGELLLLEEKNTKQLEFSFKTTASAKDRFERERVKRTFTPLKKDDGA